MKKHYFLFFAFLLFTLVSCGGYEIDYGEYGYTLVKNTNTNKVESPDAEDYVICIEKDPAKDFVILNLGDVQPNETTLSSKTTKTITYLVNTYHPNLITLTGDILTDYPKKNNKKTIENVGNFLDSFKTPWTIVFGNHDHNYQDSLPMEDQCDLYENFEYCIFKSGLQLGTTNSGKSKKLGNYVINIVEKGKSSFKVIKSLVFLDTGDTTKYEGKYSYDSLNDLQIQFFQDCMRSVQQYGRKGSVKSVLFIHIPITEYTNAIGAALKNKYSIRNLQNFLIESQKISFSDSYNEETWNVGYKDSFGVIHETIGGASFDDHVAERISSYLDTIICGHDHVNNFVVKYNGVKYCYTMKTGEGCYGGTTMSGGTLITIPSKGDVSIKHINYQPE